MIASNIKSQGRVMHIKLSIHGLLVLLRKESTR
jgi:hypothetical protein